MTRELIRLVDFRVSSDFDCATRVHDSHSVTLDKRPSTVISRTHVIISLLTR